MGHPWKLDAPKIWCPQNWSFQKIECPQNLSLQKRKVPLYNLNFPIPPKKFLVANRDCVISRQGLMVLAMGLGSMASALFIVIFILYLKIRRNNKANLMKAFPKMDMRFSNTLYPTTIQPNMEKRAQKPSSNPNRPRGNSRPPSSTSGSLICRR